MSARDDVPFGNELEAAGFSPVPYHLSPLECASQISPIRGICFLIFRGRAVLMERCPKKAAKLGVGKWFIPGGKVEAGELPEDALRREVREEIGVDLLTARELPILDGSPMPPGEHPIFLMRPYVISSGGHIPNRTLDGGVELRWINIGDAVCSPVPQVRMMLAAAVNIIPPL